MLLVQGFSVWCSGVTCGVLGRRCGVIVARCEDGEMWNVGMRTATFAVSF